MNEKVEEMKRRIKEHLDNEVELLSAVTELLSELSIEEGKELEDAMLSHPHAKSLLLLSNNDFDVMRTKVTNLLRSGKQ